MKYTDKQFQVALAKMLPKRLMVQTPLNSEAYVCWVTSVIRHTPKVSPTEWLHVCWLVEESLQPDNPYFDLIATHESWQQRAVTLAQVKGVEVV